VRTAKMSVERRSKSSSFFLVCLLLVVGPAAYGANRVVPSKDVPNFDIRAACRALAQVPEARLVGIDQADTTKNCLDEERQARAQLSKEWLQFRPADRSKCVGISRQGATEAVYTELLTCLEMARDAQQPASAHGPS
jgi:hypothetical protein